MHDEVNKDHVFSQIAMKLGKSENVKKDLKELLGFL